MMFFKYKYIDLILILVFLIFFSHICYGKTIKTKFDIRKGVNIGNWLEDRNISEEQLPYLFTLKDVDKLSSYGFDHVRLPISEMVITNQDGSIKGNIVRLIHRTIKQCKKNKIKVILDLHRVKANFYKENEESALINKGSLAIETIWQILMKEFEKYPENLLAYEILNEPVTPNDDQWNKIAGSIMKSIRERNQKRVIILGSNRLNDVGRIANLSIPLDDPNIILSFHYYEPFLLTHYGASWTGLRNLKYSTKLNYPGILINDSCYNNLDENDKQIIAPYRTKYDKSYIRKNWMTAIEFARFNSLRLYLGEFGCLPNCGERARLSWIKDVVSLCKEYNIAYSLWEYNSGFGFVNRKTGEIVNQQLLDIVVK